MPPLAVLQGPLLLFNPIEQSLFVRGAGHCAAQPMRELVHPERATDGAPSERELSAC